MELAPGRRVLDVGCGTGDDVREMAGLVGAAGLVVGIDNSQAMIAVARQRTTGTIACRISRWRRLGIFPSTTAELR